LSKAEHALNRIICSGSTSSSVEIEMTTENCPLFNLNKQSPELRYYQIKTRGLKDLFESDHHFLLLYLNKS